MSIRLNKGKDLIIFATKEDHDMPSTIQLPQSRPSPGLILPDGSINWNCPCLGGMSTGPCGVEFRDAFSCFHYSESEPKGIDCYDAFKNMNNCMSKYPSLYKKNDQADIGDMDTSKKTDDSNHQPDLNKKDDNIDAKGS